MTIARNGMKIVSDAVVKRVISTLVPDGIIVRSVIVIYHQGSGL